MSKRILFVEDNDIHRLMTQDFLEHQGHTLLSMSNGLNFLDAIADFQPDLFLLDLKLPHVDGFTLLEQLQQSQWNKIPVIVVSAYAFQEEKQKALNLGAYAYLTKPIKLDELIEVIESEPNSSSSSTISQS